MISLKKYNLIGEDHEDENIVSLLEKLLPKVDKIFMEALKRGMYEFDVDSLIDFDFVYGWNPGKYDNILRLARLNNVEVHGLDSWMSGDERPEFDVMDWSQYIKKHAGSINLVLVGGLHVGSYKGFNNNPKDVLTNYFNIRDVLTINSLENEFLKEGLQKVDCDVDY